MARAGTATSRAPVRRMRATAKPQAVVDKASATPTKSKTAVVVIHGIGEQRPLETLRGFVETVYRRDQVLASMPVGKSGMLDVSIVPDDVTGSAELRRITTLSDGPQKRTDFFEFYWADIMDGTPLDMVTGWIKMLVLRSPWRLPRARKVRRAWGLLALVVGVVAVAGLVAVNPSVAETVQSWGAIDWLGGLLNGARLWIGWIFAVIGGVLLVGSIMRAQGKMSKVGLGPPLISGLIGVALWVLPEMLADSITFWAGALTAGVAAAMQRVIGPYAGDVARYVRATPRTVERRRQVRERGVALLEALHRKRQKGPPLEDFTQGEDGNPPLYDRVIIVGHSLGTIIAYDILQLFWEKYGPTHHQRWDAGDATVQSALDECDGYVKQAWGEERKNIDLAGFEAAQARLFALLRDVRPHWRISDLITLGSPLTHAEFLLADSQEEVDQAFAERRFATSPPRPDLMQDSMLYPVPDGTENPPRYPHFAAQFAAVRWTNIYDENDSPLLGDLISGQLSQSDLYGPGISDRRVKIKRPGWPGPLRRLFTHTLYWAWHQSYDPPEDGGKHSTMDVPEAERREWLWRNVPEHIRLLREALRLGT